MINPKLKNIELQRKREEAKKKHHTARLLAKKESYVVQGDDILFISGKYAGSTMTQLWACGPLERDYVAHMVGNDTREEVRKLFVQLLCK